MSSTDRRNSGFGIRALDRALGTLLPEAGTRDNASIIPPRRLLLAKSYGMGDGVLIRSLADHMLRFNPSLELGVLGCPPLIQVLRSTDRMRIHQYDPTVDGARAMFRLLREVRRVGYDAVIDFEAFTLLSATFIRMAAIPVRIGLKPPVDNPRARLLTHAVALDPERSMWSHFVDLVRTVEPRVEADMGATPMPCSDDARSWGLEWWKRHTPAEGLVIAVHLGTGLRGSYRRWPVGNFAKAAARLGASHRNLVVLLTGTAQDAPLMREFKSAYGGPVVEASDAKSLEHTACLLARCSLLLSNDTGVMHLGAAMGTPTIGLFGPTSLPHWAPVGRRAVALRGTRLPCSPCIDMYHNRMPMRCSHAVKSQCMLDITVDMVVRAAERMLDGSSQTDSH